MKTPKRQFPEMPTCPICGGELSDDVDDRDYHFNSYIYCKNDSDHLTIGVDVTKAEYEKLEETYFRVRNQHDVYVVDNGIDLIRARWKRKNKEAQLKRTIARLRRIERRKLRQDKLLQLYRRRVSCLKWEIEDAQKDIENESASASAWENRYYRLLHMAHGYCSATTCGQDIEGS